MDPELTVIRDMHGNVLRMEWTKGEMYFSFNGDEVQGAIDAMTSAFNSIGDTPANTTVAISLFKTAFDAAPGDFV